MQPKGELSEAERQDIAKAQFVAIAVATVHAGQHIDASTQTIFEAGSDEGAADLQDVMAAYDEILAAHNELYEEICASMPPYVEFIEPMNPALAPQAAPSNEGCSMTYETSTVLPPPPSYDPPSPPIPLTISNHTPPNQCATSSWSPNIGDYIRQAHVENDWCNWELHSQC